MPENPDGWLQLARSYSELQRFPEAHEPTRNSSSWCLAKLTMGKLCDVYAMANNQSLQGEPTRLLNRALELDGNNTLALALSALPQWNGVITLQRSRTGQNLSS